MPIYFEQEANTGRAVWRSEDGAEEITLCGVSLAAFDSEAVVREHFTALVNAVADHHRRMHVAVALVSVASRLEGIPCRDCTAPEADDVRHRAGSVSDISELQLSPGGYPAGCCKRVTLAVIGGQPDWSSSSRAPAPARRVGRRY
jgi:hypothetical protein